MFNKLKTIPNEAKKTLYKKDNKMSLLKKFLSYLIWTVLALLIGITYMRFVLGTNTVSKEGMGYVFHMFYNWGLLHVGAIIGLSIAFLFILFDIFYLKKKLKKHKTAIRFMVILVITLIVAIIHYVLEKIINII